MAGYVEEVGCHIVIPVDEHSGNSQCITAVIARSGKDDDGRRAAPMVGNGLGQRLSCPLHQIDGFYGFMLNGIFVQLRIAEFGRFFVILQKFLIFSAYEHR